MASNSIPRQTTLVKSDSIHVNGISKQQVTVGGEISGDTDEQAQSGEVMDQSVIALMDSRENVGVANQQHPATIKVNNLPYHVTVM